VPGDAIAVCAAGEAVWQQCAHVGLGGPWRADPGLAWSTWVPHRFLLAGVTLTARPALPAGLVQQQPGIVCDSWATLEPGDLPGWTTKPADPWMIREPAPCRSGVPRTSPSPRRAMRCCSKQRRSAPTVCQRCPVRCTLSRARVFPGSPFSLPGEGGSRSGPP